MSVDNLVDNSLELLQLTTLLVRSGHCGGPAKAKTNQLCAAANELHRAALASEDEDPANASAKKVADLGLSSLKAEIGRLTEVAHEQLSNWKHQVSAARANVTDLRSIDVQNYDVAEIVKKAMHHCKTELMACANTVPLTCEPIPSMDSSPTHSADQGADADLRNPITATESLTDFPFQHLQASDIAASTPIWDWLINVLPATSVERVGVFYRRVDLRQMLLKCIVCAEELSYDDPQLLHLVHSCVAQLSESGKAPQEHDVLRCVADAFTTLFLYTVNLDGHFADPATTQPLPAEKSLELLTTIEWPRQKGDKSGPKLPDSSVAVKTPSASVKPPNHTTFGYNPAIWAVANWTLRVGGDPAATVAVRQEARRGAHVYKLFAEHLAWALQLLPPTHCTVYRGIRGRTTRPYVQNTVVAWPAFSSTSTKDVEALGFMGKDRGTFFIVHCDAARDIAFASWYPNQAELLLPPARQFKVQSRVSNTVLTMLESNVEFIVMREHDYSGNTVSNTYQRAVANSGTIANQAIDAVSKTVFMYDTFIQKYVPGRLSAKRANVEEQNVVGIQTFAASLNESLQVEEETTKAKGHIIVGDGGTGKTSAMLYLLFSLATSANAAVVPVFVSLPALDIWDPVTQTPKRAPIDAFICSALGLDHPEQLAALAAKRKLVVLLDSLDEVASQQRQHLHDIVSRNPLLSTHAAHVVVSTRSEALPDAREMMVSSTPSTLYCLPFRPQDARTMLDAAAKRKGIEEVDSVWKQLERWRVLPVLSNPFVASMCIETALTDATHLTSAHESLVEEPWQPMKETTVYEAYLRNKLLQGDQKEPRFQQATNIACHLTSMHTSHATIEQLGTDTQLISTVLRYESLEPTAAASFRHKSLQEFLVARAICCELYAVKDGPGSPQTAVSVLKALPQLSRHFPNAIRLTANILQGNATTFRTATESLAQVVTSSGLQQDAQAAGTALSILVRTGLPLVSLLPPSGLANAVIRDANLDGAYFARVNMENASFRNCALTNCDFTSANVTNASIMDCDFGELPSFKHTAAVIAVAFAPDGKHVASGGWDKMVKIHNISTGKEIHCFTSHAENVSCVAFSPDSQFVASGSEESSIQIHRLSDGELVHKHMWYGSGSKIERVIFSPDGALLASCNGGSKVKIHNADTGEEVVVIQHDATGISFSPDSKLIASAGFEGIKINRCDNGEELLSVEGCAINTVAFSPDGRHVAIGDETIKIYAVDSGEEVSSITSHNGDVNFIAYSFDGKLLASGSSDATVRVHQVDTGEEVSAFAGHSDVVYCIDFSPDGQMVVSSSEDQTVRIHSLSSDNEQVSTFTGHDNKLHACAFSPDGRFVASGGMDNTVKVHVVGTGEEVFSFSYTETVKDVAFSMDGSLIASGSDDHTARIHRLQTGEEVFCFKDHTNLVDSVTFSPDGKLFASGSSDATVKIYELETGKLVTSFRSQNRGVYSVRFSPDSKLVASGSWDKSVHVHDIATKASVFESKFSISVLAVAFSPDGQYIAFGSKIYNLATKEEVCSISGHEVTGASAIRSLCFSPDGKVLASASDDYTVGFHSMENHAQLPNFTGHGNSVYGVAFSQDGQFVASTGWDKSVKVCRTENIFVADDPAAHNSADVLLISKMRQSRFGGVVGSISKETSDDNVVVLFDEN